MSEALSGSLFDSEFVSHPPRWFGRIVSKESWTGNIASEKFDNISDIKGWGYRYKVRIFSWHTGDKNIVPDEQLVMANAILPTTAGSGLGGSATTPSIEPGSVVTGFFMDGMGGQEPYIDGILGNSNNNVPKEQGGKSPTDKATPPVPANVDSLSATALKKLLNPSKTPTIQEFRAASEARQKAKAAGLPAPEVERLVLAATVKASQNVPSAQSKNDSKTIGYSLFNNTYNEKNAFVPDDLIVGDVPKSTMDSVHIVTLASKDQEVDRKKKQHLLNACKKKNSEMKGIQKTMKDLVNEIERIKKQIGAVSSKVTKLTNQVQSLISEASAIISSYMKTILGGVRGYVLNKVSKQVRKIAPKLFPSEIAKLNVLSGKATESLSCVFSKIIRGLKGLIGGLLEKVLDKAINIPLCAAENLTAGILDKVLGPIMNAVNAAMAPIFALIGTLTGAAGAVTGALGSVSALGGNLFSALDFATGIGNFFKCDDDMACPDYDEIMLGGPPKPGGDATATPSAKDAATTDPTGTGQGAADGPPSASVATKTSDLQVGQSNAETKALAASEQALIIRDQGNQGIKREPPVDASVNATFGTSAQARDALKTGDFKLY